MAKTANLAKAKEKKNDEFYTQWADIQKEVNAYPEFDPDTFRGKSVLLPCDDPEWSNFTKFFAQNFEAFGLRRLVSTSYAFASKKFSAAVRNRLGYWQPTLFESESPQYDAEKSPARGKIFVLDRDANGNGRIDIEDLRWSYLEGDGDFRSETDSSRQGRNAQRSHETQRRMRDRMPGAARWRNILRSGGKTLYQGLLPHSHPEAAMKGLLSLNTEETERRRHGEMKRWTMENQSCEVESTLTSPCLRSSVPSVLGDSNSSQP